MKQLIDCAMKRTPCDLVVKNAKVVNVFDGSIEEGEVAVKNGKIVGIGTDYEAEKVYDAKGAYVLPGLMDSHIHVESSLLSPEAFARLAAIHGTTGIVADPHEITNVCGIPGAEYMKEAFNRIHTAGGQNPLDVYLQLPSCVPATPFETSGAVIDGDTTAKEIARPMFNGLGEMMNIPAVIYADEDCLKKLTATKAAGKVIDGHAPVIENDQLNAVRCAGLQTDHESGDRDSCAQKVARGMYVQLRNGSSTRNLEENCKAMTPFSFRRYIACSDDKTAADFNANGQLDCALRRMVAEGIDPAMAICTATSNIAECYHLDGKGAVAPSYDADFILVDNLKDFNVSATFKMGELIAENGEALFDTSFRYMTDAVKGSVHIKPVTADNFKIAINGKKTCKIMTLIKGTVVTGMEKMELSGEDDVVLPENILKLAVVERHHATGNIGLALVKGYGFHGGAMGTSVAHDSHNLVIIGDNNEDIAGVVEKLQEMGGGMAVCANGKKDGFPLDIAGLMSSAPVEEVIKGTTRITEIAKSMGVEDGFEPFMNLAFMSLAVIPDLKLTDKGLFDVNKFYYTPLVED